ncbi:MAG: hypothetical protein GYA55_13795, partial [SAR324 cluster bacterium]|nr:hypothetical protein [SAR324 cluster bacterium]
GTSCLDCNGVPNGGAKKDVCGICNGDGTSCLDCAGTPFGVSVFDRCGVCGGDGQSCIQCTEQDLSPLHQQMIQKSKEQKGNADFFLLKVLKSDPKYAKASKNQLQRIYRKLLAVMKKLPISTKECTENPFCTTQDSHTTLINTYKNEALKIYRISKQILARPQTTGGVCSTPGCEQRVSARIRKTSSMKKYAYRLYMQNITLARRFPTQITVCD